MNADKKTYKKMKILWKKQPFVYKHSIPASIFRSQLLDLAPLD
tara:strand:- start:597 stop:725 length:129 start_codon:yes stop_codon:yes gene_type:complete